MEVAAIKRDEADFEVAPRAAPSSQRVSKKPGTVAEFDALTNEEDDEDRPAAAKLPIKVGKRLAKAPKRRVDDDATSGQFKAKGAPEGLYAPPQISQAPVVRDSDGAHGADGMSTSTKPELLTGEALLKAAKLEIASLASDILNSPDSSLQQLRQLREMCSHSDELVGAAISKLAILSLATVFKDIIPGYRIRELTDKEKSGVVSAAVKKVRDYDSSLVRNYQMFLKRLHALVKRASAKVGSPLFTSHKFSLAQCVLCL